MRVDYENILDLNSVLGFADLRSTGGIRRGRDRQGQGLNRKTLQARRGMRTTAAKAICRVSGDRCAQAEWPPLSVPANFAGRGFIDRDCGQAARLAAEERRGWLHYPRPAFIH